MSDDSFLPPATPDIVSRVRYEGNARNTELVKVAIVVPAPQSVAVYGRIVVEVKVFSKTKRGYHFRGIKGLSGMSERDARRLCGILGGALAERIMSVQLLENVSAVEYANEAMSAWDSALAHFEAKQHTPLPRDKTLDYILQALNELDALR